MNPSSLHTFFCHHQGLPPSTFFLKAGKRSVYPAAPSADPFRKYIAQWVKTDALNLGTAVSLTLVHTVTFEWGLFVAIHILLALS